MVLEAQCTYPDYNNYWCRLAKNRDLCIPCEAYCYHDRIRSHVIDQVEEIHGEDHTDRLEVAAIRAREGVASFLQIAFTTSISNDYNRLEQKFKIDYCTKSMKITS